MLREDRRDSPPGHTGLYLRRPLSVDMSETQAFVRFLVLLRVDEVPMVRFWTGMRILPVFGLAYRTSANGEAGGFVR